MGFLKRFFGLEPMADEATGVLSKNAKVEPNKVKGTKKTVNSAAGIPDEVVAVITAAVHEFENDSYVTPAFNIKPIDRRSGDLSAYGKERIYLNLR